jgi:hypothetical protein
MTERPTRLMKARHESACAHCGRWLGRGTQIGLMEKGWVEVTCIIKMQDTATEPAPADPGTWSDVYTVPEAAQKG